MRPAVGLRTVLTWAVVIVALAIELAFAMMGARDRQAGGDLYHPWGVTIVRGEPGGPRSPYAEPAAFGARLRALVAEGSATPRLRSIARAWQSHSDVGIAPTGTPLFYAIIAFLPRDFEQALVLWMLLQYPAMGVAVYALARMRTVPRLWSIMAAAVVLNTFDPFIADVTAGNVTSMQLLALTGLLYASARGSWERHAAIDRWYLAALALLVLFKPNALWIAAAMAVHYGVARGARRLGSGAARAVFAAAVAVAAAAASFQDPMIWRDWLRFVQGAHGASVLYGTNIGNHSFAMTIAGEFPGLSALHYGILFGALFCLLAALAAYTRERGFVRSVGEFFREPWRAMSAGVVLTFASAPLVWYHYCVFMLVPIVWLLSAEHYPRFSAACALVSFATLFQPLVGLLFANELYGVEQAAHRYGWLALLCGVLAQAWGSAHGLRPRVANGAPKPL